MDPPPKCPTSACHSPHHQVSSLFTMNSSTVTPSLLQARSKEEYIDIAIQISGSPKKKLKQGGDWKSTERRPFLGSYLSYNMLVKEKKFI